MSEREIKLFCPLSLLGKPQCCPHCCPKAFSCHGLGILATGIARPDTMITPSPLRGLTTVLLRNVFSHLQTGKADLAIVIHRGYIAFEEETDRKINENWNVPKFPAASFLCICQIQVWFDWFSSDFTCTYIFSYLTTSTENSYQEPFKIWLRQNLGTPWNGLYKIRNYM